MTGETSTATRAKTGAAASEAMPPSLGENGH